MMAKNGNFTKKRVLLFSIQVLFQRIYVFNIFPEKKNFSTSNTKSLEFFFGGGITRSGHTAATPLAEYIQRLHSELFSIVFLSATAA